MRLELTARGIELDPKLKSYVEEKIGGIEKYLPRNARQVAAALVVLEEDPSGREDNRFVCDVVLTLPDSKLVSREGTVSIFAAVDIVEAKLKVQTVRYKEKHVEGQRRLARLTRWFGRRSPAAEPAAAEAEGSAQPDTEVSQG
jgi:ribosomal subunit interface protein